MLLTRWFFWWYRGAFVLINFDPGHQKKPAVLSKSARIQPQERALMG